MIVRDWKKRSKSLNPPPLGRRDWSLVESSLSKVAHFFGYVGSFCKEKFGVLKSWLFEEEEIETLVIDEKVSLKSSWNKSLPQIEMTDENKLKQKL